VNNGLNTNYEIWRIITQNSVLPATSCAGGKRSRADLHGRKFRLNPSSKFNLHCAKIKENYSYYLFADLYNYIINIK
jgi:hypothetical protein